VTRRTNHQRRDEPAPAHSAPVEIRTDGAWPPLFCLHALAGHADLYAGLARHLTPPRVVHGLRAPGLDGECAPYRTFEAMAAHHARAVRRVQPHGPYLIVGECLGGALAYELAQQLRAAGEEVALLALIDSFATGRPRLRRLVPGPAYNVLHRARILGFHTGNLVRLAAREKVAYATEKARRAQDAVGRRVARVARRRGPVLETRAAFEEAVAAYEPKPYAGRVVLFRAERLPLGIESAPDLGWGPFAEDLEIERIPGYFTTPISEPGVRILAARIGSCIDARTRERPLRRVHELTV